MYVADSVKYNQQPIDAGYAHSRDLLRNELFEEKARKTVF